MTRDKIRALEEEIKRINRTL